jgi:hypothetical protein
MATGHDAEIETGFQQAKPFGNARERDLARRHERVEEISLDVTASPLLF